MPQLRIIPLETLHIYRATEWSWKSCIARPQGIHLFLHLILHMSFPHQLIIKVTPGYFYCVALSLKEVFEVAEIESVVKVELQPFLTALSPNSKIVSRTGSTTPLSCFASNFTEEYGIVVKIFKVVENHSRCSYYSKGFWQTWTYPKFSQKNTDPYVKFDEIHDGDVAEPLRQTILELCPTFVQKWHAGQPNMVLP